MMGPGKHTTTMKEQNYKNHVRYYPPHHFVFLPMMGFLTGFSIYKAVIVEDDRLSWLVAAVLSFCITFLAIMLRQHYALGNQDRIVRLEFRLRYFETFGKSSKEAEKKLSFSQIAALRFSGDGEFPKLLDRALNEDLDADTIKKSITDWQADDMRL